MATGEGESLEEVLEQFDRAHERRPVLVSDQERKESEAWAGAFEEQRERVLRAELEQVAWDLERSGHHAWLDDVAPDEAAATAAQRAGVSVEAVVGIELCILPAADQRTASMAPRLRFVPDLEARLVRVQVQALEPGDHAIAEVGAVATTRLDPRTVRELGTRLAAEVFLHHHRVLDPSSPESTIADPDLDWAPERGGIAPTRGTSGDWVG